MLDYGNLLSKDFAAGVKFCFSGTEASASGKRGRKVRGGKKSTKGVDFLAGKCLLIQRVKIDNQRKHLTS